MKKKIEKKFKCISFFVAGVIFLVYENYRRNTSTIKEWPTYVTEANLARVFQNYVLHHKRIVVNGLKARIGLPNQVVLKLTKRG